MEYIYTFFMCFILIFLSELGDKTQLLVLSFSSKSKTTNVLLGVAIGTFFSHGLAIIFGSSISEFATPTVSYYMSFFTYISFIIFGIIGFISMKYNCKSENGKISLLHKLSNLKINYIFIIATSILIGELGDKTFLASLGLSLQYPEYKISLILGSIAGMVFSNSIAIIFGKLLSLKFNQHIIEIFSNILFIIFGIIGLINCLI